MRNFYISIGIWLILIPMLGISGIWKNRLTALTGFFIFAEAVWPSIVKIISTKSGIKKKNKIKENQEMTFSQSNVENKNAEDV